MNKSAKFLLITFHLFLFLLPGVPIRASGVSTNSLKNEVEATISSFNSDIELLKEHFVAGESGGAELLIGSLNERFQEMLGQDYLYGKLVIIRQDDPNYHPGNVNDLEVALDVDYGEIAREMTESIARAQKGITDAKNNIGKQHALTWYIILMTSLKFTYDINGLFNSAGWLKFQLSWYTNDFNDRYWEYSDANYIQQRLDIQDVKTATHRATISEQEYIIVDVKNKLNQLAKLGVTVYALHGEIESIKNNIVRINAHIDATSRVKIPGLSEAAVFEVLQYTDPLDDNLDNVLGGAITWGDYNGTKAKILEAAHEQYTQTIGILTSQNKETIPYTRDYNDFVSYYYSFDEFAHKNQRDVTMEYNKKIEAWYQSVDDLLTDYAAIEFSDYSPVHLNIIEVAIPHIDILDLSVRQVTQAASWPHVFSGHILLEPRIDASESWYQSLLDHPQDIENSARRLFDLTNAARESEVMYEDSTGIATWFFTVFSTLFSSQDDSLKAAENLDDMYDYLEGFDGYALEKSREAYTILNQLDDVRAKQTAVESYLDSVNPAYNQTEAVTQNGVPINTGKLPSMFGRSLSLAETEAMCDYIKNDLDNFIFQAQDLSFVNDIARQNIRSMYEYETEKYDFITSLNSRAKELVNGMEPHRELLSELDDFRDVYKGYLSGIDGSDSLVTQEYLQEKMDAISSYPSLAQFVQLQEDINEITRMIKPVMGPQSVYGGFRGNFSVLESDREIVSHLRAVEYVPSGEVSLLEIKSGFSTIHDVLDQPYADMMKHSSTPPT